MRFIPERLVGLWALRRTRMVKHLAWSVAGQASVAIIGLGSVRVFTELAAPGVFGAANLLITMLMLFSNIGVNPVVNTQALYHARYAASGEEGAFTGAVLRLALLGGAVGSLIMTIGYAGWMEVKGHNVQLGMAAILLVWIPVQGFRNVLLMRISAERRQARNSAWLTAEAGATFVLVAGALLIAATPVMFLAGHLAAITLVAVIFFVISSTERDLRPRPGSRFDRSTVLPLVRDFGTPFAAIAVLSWFGNLSERYVLGGFFGVAAVGVYAAAFGIASRAMQIVGLVAVNAFRPALYEAEGTGRTLHARAIFRAWLAFTAGIATLVVIAIMLFAPLIARILLAEEYREHAPTLMMWIAAGFGVQVVNQVVESRVMSLGNSSRLIWPMAVGAAGNLGLALLLIPRFGITGAAMAIAGSFPLQLAATTIALLRLQKRLRAAEQSPSIHESGAIGPAPGPTEKHV